MSRFLFIAFIALLLSTLLFSEPPQNITAREGNSAKIAIFGKTAAVVEIKTTAAIESPNKTGDPIVLKKADLPGKGLAIQITDGKDNDQVGVFLSGKKIHEYEIKADDRGNPTINVAGEKLVPHNSSKKQRLHVIISRKDAEPKSIDLGTIIIDTEGPRLNSVDLVGEPGQPGILIASFRDDDIDEEDGDFTVTVKKLDDQGQEIGNDVKTASTFAGGILRVTVGALHTGLYRLSIAKLNDKAGNTSEPEKLTYDFNSFPGPAPQPAVEFPQALPAKLSDQDRQNANPGDYVETRVARLYYFRDAHRVAQIINRNTRSYNAAAVSVAQQRYERTRKAYESATDERRQKEREAYQISEERALKDREIRQQQQMIDQLQSEHRLMRQQESAFAPEGSMPDNTKSDAYYQQQIVPLQMDLKRIQEERDLLREEENKASLESQKLQDVEDRSAADEFRERVNAFSADPNTYAPAKTDSVDPVAQVSVSVIGEGLLHLRGPIQGINKIRLMINQIDTPLGQVKVGINTVQINGEDARRIEKVAGMVEGHIGLGRHLTMQSLRMLRRAVVQVAGEIAMQAENMGHYQIDRDRKYLYLFFGKDFIDELYEMDSEFLRTENKLLSLHSMDTISLNRALFIFSLAKNDIREDILQRFLAMTQCELPEAEWKYRRSSELFPHRTRLVLPFTRRDKLECNTLEQVKLNAQQRYLFTNFQAFFQNENLSPDTINPMQRTFIRLAQIFKSQLVSEMELKQRVIERFVIEDERQKSIEDEQREGQRIRELAKEANRAATDEAVEVLEMYFAQTENLSASLALLLNAESNLTKLQAYTQLQIEYVKKSIEKVNKNLIAFQTKETAEKEIDKEKEAFASLQDAESVLSDGVNLAKRIQTLLEAVPVFNANAQSKKAKLLRRVSDIIKYTQLTVNEISSTNKSNLRSFKKEIFEDNKDHIYFGNKFSEELKEFVHLISYDTKYSAELIEDYLKETKITSSRTDIDERKVNNIYRSLKRQLETALAVNSGAIKKEIAELLFNLNSIHDSLNKLVVRQRQRKFWEETIASYRTPLDRKKLLDHLIEERTEKYVELLEGTRSHISVVDNYLKRLAMALEDDFKIQFYDPAFTRIRLAASKFKVTLGQVERTNVLMNNRSLAVVQPTATMEFNLPHRDIFIIEAMDNARALVQDFGPLLKDPTFLAAFDLFGGAGVPDTVKKAIPGLESQSNEQNMGMTNQNSQQFGDNLKARVPDPAIYKFETGTGFEIKPVIQPDGDSLVYDFNYMYTTNIREPVNPNEKHLGRVKRHFVNTQVQTSSFAMREISKYQVSLKAARTAKGVPGLGEIPVIGQLFKPLPSADSSLQENVILGQTTIYPTLFDLMGLRWAKHVVDLDHVNLRDQDKIVRGRYNTISDVVFETSSDFVDDFLDVKHIKNGRHYRPDLYHQQRHPSPFHPRGYIHKPALENTIDPTGNEYRIPDRRPEEFRQPPYDERFRRPIRQETYPQSSRKINPLNRMGSMHRSAPRPIQQVTYFEDLPQEVSPRTPNRFGQDYFNPQGTTQDRARGRFSNRRNY